MDEYDLLFTLPDLTEETEVRAELKASTLRRQGKRKLEQKLKQEQAAEVLTQLPEVGEYLHIISNGRFDYYDLIARMIDLTGETVEELYLSTWCLNRTIAREIVNLYDTGKAKKISMLLNFYFKTRDSAVYAYLTEAFKARGQVLKCAENHAKLAFFKTASGRCFAMEGSANLTANPRIEQNVITQGDDVFNFYKSVFLNIFSKSK